MLKYRLKCCIMLRFTRATLRAALPSLHIKQKKYYHCPVNDPQNYYVRIMRIATAALPPPPSPPLPEKKRRKANHRS